MSFENLSDELREVVISLPYRVGYYISISDRTGGALSDAAELKSLEDLLTFYVEDSLKGEFAQAVMVETLRRKVFWSSWRNNTNDILREVRDTLVDLEIRVDDKNLRAFKYNLYEIAQTVAMSFSEAAYQHADSLFVAWIKRALGMKPKTQQNISDKEQIALDALAQALQINVRKSGKVAS